MKKSKGQKGQQVIGMLFVSRFAEEQVEAQHGAESKQIIKPGDFDQNTREATGDGEDQKEAKEEPDLVERKS
ncbi:MAG: hypothetical protein AAFN10_08550 [Bacteroidota bacterium]